MICYRCKEEINLGLSEEEDIDISKQMELCDIISLCLECYVELINRIDDLEG
jgi:hypothetical protein